MKKIVFLWIAAVVLTTACNDKFESSGINDVVLNKTALYLIHGERETLTATVDPVNASEVVWRSSNTEVATVSQTGEVTAVSAGGQAVITVVTKIGKRVATCDVFVDPIRVTGVTLELATLDMIVHETATLSYTVYPSDADDKFVTWVSNDEEVVEVDLVTGELKAVRDGEATITVITRDGFESAECVVTVTKIAVTSVTLSEIEIELELGNKVTLVATVKPDDASFPAVTWTSSDPGVATVSATGELMALSPGETVITATADGITAECNVTVPAPSGFIEKVIWEGVKQIGWGSPLSLKTSDFENVPAGSILTLYFEKEGSWPQAQLCRAVDGWPQYKFSELGNNGTINPTYFGDNNSIELLLTQGLLDEILATDDNGNCMHMQGDGITFTKVTINVPISEITLWIGDFALSWSAKGIPKAPFVDAKAGNKLRFYFSNLGGNPKLKLFYGDWAGPIIIDDPNFVPGGDDDLLVIPAGSDFYDILLTAEMVTKMNNPSWGSDALLIQGQDGTVSKITLVP